MSAPRKPRQPIAGKRNAAHAVPQPVTVWAVDPDVWGVAKAIVDGQDGAYRRIVVNSETSVTVVNQPGRPA